MYTKTRFTLTDEMDYALVHAHNSRGDGDLAVNIYGQRNMHQTVYFTPAEQRMLVKAVAKENPQLLLELVKVSVS